MFEGMLVVSLLEYEVPKVGWCSRLSALLPLELWSLKKAEAKAAIAKSDFLTHEAVTSSPLLRSGPPTAACPCSKSIVPHSRQSA